MKPDDRALLLAVYDRQPGEFVRDIATRSGIHPKRVAAILDKWTRAGWYDYGVSLDLGWLTPAGKEAAERVKGETRNA